MDTEQSGEIVEGSDPPQQEIEKEPVSKMESPADTETPAATNGEHEQVNGHSEAENGVGTEQEETQEDPKMEENVPTDEPEKEAAPSPSDKDGSVANADTESNQPEDNKPVEMAENESVPEVASVQEPVETQAPTEEEKQPENKEEKVSDNVEAEPKEVEISAAGDKKEEEKPADEVKEKSDAAEAEVTPTTAAEEVKTAEPEEDPTPAAGSLAFAILEQERTKDMLKTTRTLVVIRGLPGSGKSFLARAIADAYKDHGAVLTADDHDVKPDSPDGYKAFDEAIVAKCGDGTAPALVVVDDTNHSQDRLAHLGGIARQHQLVAVFLEPRTQWSRDTAELAKKTKRGLEQAKLETMKKPHEEMSIPLYFGWFLFFTEQSKVREMSTSFLKTLTTLESFKKHLSDFNVKEGEEVDLEQYFKAKEILHCTTKFTNYGKAEGAKEYTEKKVVQDLYSSVSELSLSALFITPRTVGAQVSLTEDQLQLWPDDAEKEAEPHVPGAGSLPPGSRAHVTLGCAESALPVQTGYDLLSILLLQKDEKQEKTVEEMESGTLTYFGEGRWYLALKEPISALACFSSSYKAKAATPVKKEKKKSKCTIL